MTNLSSNKDLTYFESLFNKYFKDMVIYASIFIPDIQTAEDLVQDLFFELWNKKIFKRSINNPRIYLFTSTRNKCLMHLRKKRPDYASLDEFVEDPRVNLSEVDEEKAMLLVERIIEDLPPKRSLIIKLRFYNGLKYNEIAETLDISLNTVKTQVRKALQQLRDMLDNLPDE